MDDFTIWLQEAGTYINTIWYEGVLGLTYGQIFIAVSIVLFAIIIRGIFARTIIRALTRAAANTQTTLDDAAVKTVSAPLQLVPVIIGIYIAAQVINLTDVAKAFSDNLLRSLIAFTIFWALNRAVGAFSFVFTGLRATLTPALVDWLVKALQVFFLAVGAAAILEIWGIQIGPILAALGVFGIAIGLGAQDLFKNLIAGMLILTEKRFEPGEWIKVDGVVEGTVEKINFRSTVIRRFDKSPVYVPNSKLSDNAVTNFTRMTHRRIYWKIGIEYSASVDQLKYIRDELEGYLLGHDAYAKPPEVTLFVRVDSFNDSSIDFMLYTFTHTTNWGEWLEIKEELALKIKEIVEAAGTGFAFPSRTLYMIDQDAPETFTPPDVSNGARQAIASAGKKLDPRGEADG